MGEKNPADALTRGVAAAKFTQCVNSWMCPTIGSLPHETPEDSDMNSGLSNWPVSCFANEESIYLQNNQDVAGKSPRSQGHSMEIIQ